MEEILVSNSDICDFLGLEKTYVHIKDKYSYNQCYDGYIVPFDINPNPNVEDSNHYIWHPLDMKFETDFKWVMKIVDKINSLLLEHDPENNKSELIISSNSLKIIQLGDEVYFVENVNPFSDPKHIYEMCLDYIKFYKEFLEN